MIKKTIITRIATQLMIGSALVALPALTGSAQAAGQPDSDTYRHIATITGAHIPPTNLSKNAWCTDINFYDANNNKYYLADTNNRQVDVVDAKTNTLETPIGRGDFMGPGGCLTGNYSQEGPTGILPIDSLHELWVGNGDSTVRVYDLDTGHLIKTISTRGHKRADELAYDPVHHVVIITNPDEVNSQNKPIPYYSLIDAEHLRYIDSFRIAHATTLEQPQWDPSSGLFYMSVPSLSNSTDTQVAVIDADGEVVHRFSAGASCSPSGLSIDPELHEAALGCFGSVEIMNLKNGDIVATIPQVSQADEVWYNSGDERYYFGSFNLNGPTYIGVVNAESHNFVANIPVNDPLEHAVAVSSRTNEVYVPVSGKGIEVFKADR